MTETAPFSNDAFLSAMRTAVRVALNHGEAAPFLGWMSQYGVKQFAEAMGAGDIHPDDLRALATTLGRAIWNHLPLPDNGYQPRKLPEPGRNDPCPCGSGRKYKQCCAGAASGMPPLEVEGILPLVLEMLPNTELARLPAKRFSPELLAGIASEWSREGDSDRALALLEPLFADPAVLDGRHAVAFDMLMNIYLEQNKPRKRKALLELCLGSRDAHLRGTALQRQCVMVFDSGAREEGWKLFHQALRESPDDPSLALLELSLLQGEGKVDMMRERARFWAARLQRRADRDEWEDVIRMMRDAAADPLSFGQSYVEDARPEFEKLAKALADLPPVSHVPALEVLDDGHGLWPENRAGWLEAWFDLDGEPGEDMAWLARHPKAWDDVEVLQRLLQDAYGSGVPLDWLDRFVVGPLLDRARAVFDAACKSAPSMPERFEWGWQENRTVLQLLAERIRWLERQERHEDAAVTCADLLRWNPDDNQGVRDAYSGILLELGRYQEVADLCAAYPDDFATLRHDLALALFALGRKGEALIALEGATKAYPKVLKTLVAAAPREPRQEQFGVTVGGDYEAWMYRELRLPVWSKTGALEWAGQYAVTKRPTRR
ncbi:MAG: SEC-C metal-binding domain-containing protein [Sulfurimicrobium sp.]|nr:SEC-C metal-binding domain-containing protein [Sulfurimicrobium sp.]